MPGKILRLK